MTIDTDPSEFDRETNCPRCGSPEIEFVKEVGMIAATGMWEGKPFQRVKKTLWACKTCGSTFERNKFITQ